MQHHRTRWDRENGDEGKGRGMTDNTQPGATAGQGPSIGKAVSGLGCLLVVAVVAFIAVSTFLSSRSTSSALDDAWAGLSQSARDAYCGSIQRDPSFDGSAVGLAALAGDGVTQYEAKSYLFEKCPLTGNPAAPPASDEYDDLNGNGSWDVGEPRS